MLSVGESIPVASGCGRLRRFDGDLDFPSDMDADETSSIIIALDVILEQKEDLCRSTIWK